MSVTQIMSNYITPIFREPGLPVFNPSILARWHATFALTGDGSGGYYYFSAYFQNVPGMFGNKCLWDLRVANFVSMAAIGTAWAYIDMGPIERSTEPVVGVPCFITGNLTCVTIGNSAMASFSQCNQWEGMKYRFSDSPGLSSQVNLYVGVNTNLVQVKAHMAGYIFDERYI